jgi:hypothetical protein
MLLQPAYEDAAQEEGEDVGEQSRAAGSIPAASMQNNPPL